jgi:hypothetical protein
MDALMDSPIDAWQQVDDYNSENGIPTFLCFDCFEQLSRVVKLRLVIYW